MKIIKHDDLMILVQLIKDCPSWGIDDFERLLDRFGSDYFIEGSNFVETTANKEMAQIRRDLKGD